MVLLESQLIPSWYWGTSVKILHDQACPRSLYGGLISQGTAWLENQILHQVLDGMRKAR